MTVVEYEAPPPLPDSRPGDEQDPGPRGWVARLRGAAEIARYIAATDFVPQQLRGNPAAIAAAILYGAEVGLEPMQSLAKVAVIRGRPTLTAEAQRGLIASAGHELWFDESTATRAIAAGRRAGSDRIGRITWTLDDAKRAGIAGGENWRRYPAEMLRARASAALARAMFADVIGGMPAAEELDGDPDNGTPGPPQTPTPDEPTPSPAARTRRRRTAPKPDEDPAPTRTGPVEAPPPPDTQPDLPPPPEPGPAPAVTDAQKRQLFALLRDVGLDQDRDRRLAYTVRIVGRELASWNDLTLPEAGRLIEDLDEVSKMPAGDERQRRLIGANEAAVLDELDQLAAEGTVGPRESDQGAGGALADPGDDEPAGAASSPEGVPYNEFPEGF